MFTFAVIEIDGDGPDRPAVISHHKHIDNANLDRDQLAHANKDRIDYH